MNNGVYLYGMMIQTHALLLHGDYPAADGYAEVAQRRALVSGETGVCAVVLASLGCAVTVDGNYLGRDTDQQMRGCFARRGISCSRLVTDDTFEGLKDFVVIDKHTRTCFGQFGAFFSDPIQRWNAPCRDDIAAAHTAAIDPFIAQEAVLAARYCRECGVPYVTIDCPYDSPLARNASVLAISGEYVRGAYPGQRREDVLALYTAHTDGLVILTGGGGEMLYARKEQMPKRLHAFEVEVVSTLGAGDTFKAGCTYGLHHRMPDDELVRFAAACAGDAVTRFPIFETPPTLQSIRRLLDGAQEA